MDKPSIWKPALIGGAGFGLLGGMPLIQCCCCLLIVAGGFVAAYLHSNGCKKIGLGFRAADGAIVGLAAGVFYALAHSIVDGLLKIVMKPDWDQMIEQMESSGMPPEGMKIAEQAVEVLSGPLGSVIAFLMVLVAALIFSTIGGLIGGAVFKAEAQAPPVPPAPTLGV